ncbi:SusC/RagA family TonB-linked outer membrane protein [Chitinophaga nivalis]|uniref:SusC/RagA family TonB-linked outer membrane protein n=1 Tax=Chitinophaga nivalis TaxID=2991709 RepID=A0ABT3IML2_9BACT|nr:SusC/RagA family TonB-linked outer membrane protein [Chitinophaga nivalis]MCW3465288.1 SusC/RagA family TonB-linked outer membrane protein [Chitinophaga nivalis]MCW3485020.1 SusC/RagA family TonB-linked outer membrane protein [Chitinophaga nivalis]
MKTFLLHRILMLFFLLSVGTRLLAQSPQDRTLNFSGSTLTVRQFIQQMKTQQQLQVTFDEEVNALLSRNIHIRKQTTTLKEALGWLATDATIQCRIVGNYAILSVTQPVKKQETPPATQFELPPPSTKALGEVVVTALGIKKTERNLGYAISQLSSKDVSDVPQPNVMNSLAARVPGVSIRSTGSDPGSSVMVTIRGQSSISKENQPLYVIDGVPVAPAIQNPAQAVDGKQTIDYGSPISDISADDIASITVLKGASAAALYGSRAGSGVILITTKSGPAKKGLGVSFNSTVMFDKAYLFPEFQNEFGSGDWYGTDNTLSTGAWGPQLNTGRNLVQWNSPLDQNGKPVPLEWKAYPNRIKDFFRTGRTLTNNIAVSKSGDAGNFRISYANMQNQGIVPNTDMKRNNLTFSGTYHLNKSIHVSSNIAYTNSSSDNRPSAYTESVTMQLYKLTPNVDIHALRNYWIPGKEGLQQYNPYSTDDNPYLIAYEETNSYNRNRLTGNVQVQLDLRKDLTLMLRTGLDYYAISEDQKRPFSAKRNPKGAYVLGNNQFKEQNSDFLLTYKPELKNDFKVSVAVGGNRMDQQLQSNQQSAGSLTLPEVYNLSNAAAGSIINAQSKSHKRINSVYGMSEISYKDYIFLNLTARNDWSSTLPPSNNSYFYPSVSLSAILSEMLDIRWKQLSYLKVRANWSQVGSDTDPYQLFNTVPFDTDWGSVKRATISFSQRNSQLKPEIATSYEAGLEAGFFKDRLGINVTWYKTNNRNQIIQVPTTIASGASNMLINAGNIQNSGWEIGLNTVPVKGAFTWKSDINFTKNQNKVISLTPAVTSYMLGSTDGSNLVYQIKEGTKMGDFYSRSWVKVKEGPFAGQALLNKNGLQQQDPELVKIGNYNPDFMVGFNNNFRYKNLTLNFLIDWRQGGSYYSYVAKSLIQDGRTTNTLPGRDAAHGGLTWTDANGNVRNDGMIMEGVIDKGDGTYKQNDIIIAAADYYDNKYWKYYENETYSATYVKLKEVSLTYAFGRNVMRRIPFLSNLALSLIGNNLYIWTAAGNGYDPEITMSLSNQRYQGVGHWTLPGTRSYGAKLSCNF